MCPKTSGKFLGLWRLLKISTFWLAGDYTQCSASRKNHTSPHSLDWQTIVGLVTCADFTRHLGLNSRIRALELTLHTRQMSGFHFLQKGHESSR